MEYNGELFDAPKTKIGEKMDWGGVMSGRVGGKQTNFLLLFRVDESCIGGWFQQLVSPCTGGWFQQFVSFLLSIVHSQQYNSTLKIMLGISFSFWLLPPLHTIKTAAPTTPPITPPVSAISFHYQIKLNCCNNFLC